MLQHVSIEVRSDDVDACVRFYSLIGFREVDPPEALRAAGFDPEPRDEHWGCPRSFVRNPAGHRVELMQCAPR
jgi:hypothetical protein